MFLCFSKVATTTEGVTTTEGDTTIVGVTTVGVTTPGAMTAGMMVGTRTEMEGTRAGEATMTGAEVVTTTMEAEEVIRGHQGMRCFVVVFVFKVI